MDGQMVDGWWMDGGWMCVCTKGPTLVRSRLWAAIEGCGGRSVQRWLGRGRRQATSAASGLAPGQCGLAPMSPWIFYQPPQMKLHYRCAAGLPLCPDHACHEAPFCPPQMAGRASCHHRPGRGHREPHINWPPSAQRRFSDTRFTPRLRGCPRPTNLDSRAPVIMIYLHQPSTLRRPASRAVLTYSQP